MECKQRLESFQGLDRCLEADSSWENVVLDSCLSHDRSNQVVCENVSPDLFPDQFWSLASQFFVRKPRFSILTRTSLTERESGNASYVSLSIVRGFIGLGQVTM